jgi:hypothetical protein
MIYCAFLKCDLLIVSWLKKSLVKLVFHPEQELVIRYNIKLESLEGYTDVENVDQNNPHFRKYQVCLTSNL